MTVNSITAQNQNFYGIFPVVSHSGILSKKFEYNFFLFTALNTFKQEYDGVKYPKKAVMFYVENTLIYNFNPKFSVAASYTYQRNNPFTSDYSNENRLWQQVTYRAFLKKTKLIFRLRFDERFTKDRVTNERPLSTRLRGLVGIELRLKKDTDKYYFTAYNEFFFNTSKPTYSIYAENWAYAGVGIKTQKYGSFEVGPLYIGGVRNANIDLQNLIYLQLSWITNIDWRKKDN